MLQKAAAQTDLYRLFGLVPPSALVPAGADGPAARPPQPAVVSAPAREPREAGIRVKVPVAEWLEHTGFSPLNQRATLNQVLVNVERAMAAFRRHGGQRPLVIFDLDDTLFQAARPRSHMIMKEWLATASLPPDIKGRLASLRMKAYGYGPPEIFEAAGFDINNPRVAPVFADFKAFWVTHFFSNDFLKYDLPQPGAVDFVNDVQKLGANIAYLTGRDAAKMTEGSLAALAAAGFPTPSKNVRLVLKEDPAMPDDEFKRQARDSLVRFGKPIATFDNSPSNIVALRDSFPGAMNVFVKTLFDKAPVELRSGLYKVSSFERV